MIGLVTVNYNQYGMTREFLDSMAKVHNPEKLSVFISDVSDRKEHFDVSGYPMQVRIESLPNRGYAFGINQGVKHHIATGLTEFCAINNDISFDRGFAIEAEAGFRKANAFGGKILYAPGFEYHKKYRKSEIGKVIWYAGGINDWNNVYTYHRGVDEVDKGQFDVFGATEFVTGCMFFFNSKVVDSAGFWDEGYFLYYEDSDYCERVKRAGVGLYYNPRIVIYHKNAQSTGGSGSALQMKYQRRNRLVFGLKYAPWRTKLHLLKNHLLGR